MDSCVVVALASHEAVFALSGCLCVVVVGTSSERYCTVSKILGVGVASYLERDPFYSIAVGGLQDQK